MMDSIYDEMEERNSLLIKERGYSFDEKLLLEKDDRRCFAVFSLFDSFEFSPILLKIYDLLSTLKCGVKYHPHPQNLDGKLHWTFLQILGFSSTLEEYSPANVSDYISAVRETFTPNFDIFYSRIIITPSSVILCGDSIFPVNERRDAFRAKIKEKNLVLREPYYNNIIHSTLFRFTSLPSSEDRITLSKVVSLPESCDVLSIGRVRSCCVSPVSWKVTEEYSPVQ